MKDYTERDSILLANLHNESPNAETYSLVLDSYPVHANRRKCRCCGGEIYYSNTRLKSHRDCSVSPVGTSYMTYKVMFDATYNLEVCEECMKKEFPELETKNMSKIYNMPTKYVQYAFNVPEDVMTRKRNELCVRSVDSMIKKYGEEEGRRRWDAYVEKQRITNTFEYKRDKYGFSKEDFDAYNKSRAVTLENLISKHGEEEGRRIWDEYRYKQMYSTTREYFVETYGEDAGVEKWEAFNKARFIERSYSYISQELFNAIMDEPGMSGDEVYYMTRNREYEINIKDRKKLYYLDFYDATLSLCIEFNGNKFHPKPGDYQSGDMFKDIYNGTETPVDVYWEKESERVGILKDLYSIDTIIIWEDEYRKDKKGTVDKIINIINERRNDRLR